ncbi:hypothetical protein G6F42_029020 [Rhizopus arrhizus]|nr:hypothetical protein G6F42_029020 [Rhizopus arrhizus]
MVLVKLSSIIMSVTGGKNRSAVAGIVAGETSDISELDLDVLGVMGLTCDTLSSVFTGFLGLAPNLYRDSSLSLSLACSSYYSSLTTISQVTVRSCVG